MLAKPQSFMNLSGQPATSLRGFYKVPPEEVIVVHDDVDLPAGDIRIKKGGGHGGHNGLRDIAAKFGTAGFLRVRFGVGRPPSGWRRRPTGVLAAFDSPDAVPEWTDRAADAVTLLVDQGATAAMNRFNTRKKPKARGTQEPPEPPEAPKTDPGSRS